MVKMIDVANAAGVSIATVSRVLNGTPVRDDMAEAVNRAIEELQYSPDRRARSLRRRVSTVVALIVADIENPFFTAFARGVEDITQSEDLSLVLCNSDERPEKEARYLQTVIEEGMAGVILVPASHSTELRPIMDRGITVVIADRLLDHAIDHVYFDNVKLGSNATSCLIENGYTRIACVTGPRTVPTAVDRAAGWRAQLLHSRLCADSSLLFHSDFRTQGGEMAVKHLLALPQPPDAIVAANNMVGVGVLRALGAANRQDIGVSVIGDLPFATTISPHTWLTPLNTIEMGRTAARMLVERIKGEVSTPARYWVQDVPMPVPQSDYQMLSAE